MHNVLRIVGLATVIVIGTAAPAFAHSRANASRPPANNDGAGGQGRLIYLDGQRMGLRHAERGSLLEGSRNQLHGRRADCRQGVLELDVELDAARHRHLQPPPRRG